MILSEILTHTFMNLGSCSTALFVRDIHKAKDFYINLLGLEVEYDFGTNVALKGGVALWQVKEDHPIPQKLGVENTLNRSSNRFELYFETENLQEVYRTLSEAGVAFLHEVHEEEWGQRTIRFFDPDSHLIEIGEAMPTFLQRLYGQGLTVEEVSEKTGVSGDDIRRLLNL